MLLKLPAKDPANNGIESNVTEHTVLLKQQPEQKNTNYKLGKPRTKDGARCAARVAARVAMPR